MENISLVIQEKINKVIDRNSLILFNQNNEAVRFEYQRHICSNLNEIPGKTNNEKIFNSISIAIHLWNSWEIHIKNSTYPYEWYGCIQVEDEWLKQGKNTPPYIFFNSKAPDKVKNFNVFDFVELKEFPIIIQDIDILKNKDIKIKKAFFEEDDSIVWRICYS